MWDMSSFQGVNTTREVTVKMEVIVIRLIITTYVEKKSTGILCVEKDTPKHASLFKKLRV